MPAGAGWSARMRGRRWPAYDVVRSQRSGGGGATAAPRTAAATRAGRRRRRALRPLQQRTIPSPLEAVLRAGQVGGIFWILNHLVPT
jgi:hypothetical protein